MTLETQKSQRPSTAKPNIAPPRPKPGVNASPHVVTEVERPPKEQSQPKTS
jgi:hypothetical protein